MGSHRESDLGAVISKTQPPRAIRSGSMGCVHRPGYARGALQPSHTVFSPPFASGLHLDTADSCSHSHQPEHIPTLERTLAVMVTQPLQG